MSQGQIVAMGGGGFSMEPENPRLDAYVLGLTDKERPKVCFIGTASGDSEDYIDRFHKAFSAKPCESTHLSLFKPQTSDPLAFVMEQDVIYVGGGNTRNLLLLWREWGLDACLRHAWQAGVILAGISAGALCWFEEGVTDSLPGHLSTLRCLGFLPGSFCPHYDSETKRRPAFHEMIRTGALGAGFAADDGAALHFCGDQLVRAVSSRPRAKAYWVERCGGNVQESPLETLCL